MKDQPFFIPALLIGVAGLPLIFGMIPRNRIYGIRTAKTLAEENVWYPANRFGGWAIVLASGVYLAFAATLPMAGPREAHFSLWLAHLGAFAGPLGIGLVLTLRHVRRL